MKINRKVMPNMTNEKKGRGRGKKPSTLTIYQLCALSAGRCQFEGCNKYLFNDDLTLKDFNGSIVAHIIASSPEGPRGDAKLSHELSDQLSNLMLMCPEHHDLIDSNPTTYTVEALKKMKRAKEERVKQLTQSLAPVTTTLLTFRSPIKGVLPASISQSQAIEALLPNYRLRTEDYPIHIEIELDEQYRSRRYWLKMNQRITDEVSQCIRNAQSRNAEIHFSVFPLAPIAAVIKLGNLMGDKVPCSVYQKTRMPDTWEWQEHSTTNTFETEKQVIRLGGTKVALIMSLTADIALERIKSVFDPDVIFTLRARRLGVDCIKSEEDLSLFWHEYLEICDQIKNSLSNVAEIAVFPAIPVSAAFEVGRRYMPHVYPKLKIYDDDNGFFETLTIG